MDYNISKLNGLFFFIITSNHINVNNIGRCTYIVICIIRTDYRYSLIDILF